MGFLLIFLVGMAENGDFEWLRDATEEDIVFWKKFLNVKSDDGKYYNEYGLQLHGMTDKRFAEECIFYEEWLKLDNQLFYEYYKTNWLQLSYVPYVVRLRYYACF